MTIGAQPVQRADGRLPGDLRPVTLTLGVQKWAEGSCLIKVGGTEVLCAATIEDKIPPHLRGKGTGWVTAEYSMLPRATSERSVREAAKGKLGGRTHEIQRLVGRSLRGVVDMAKLGERTITIDCDVLNADGGTRTASITGGWVALAAALRTYGMERCLIGKVAAVSVGIVNGVTCLDLDYSEDSKAEVDFNVVATDAGRYVELQGTAEGKPFERVGHGSDARLRERRPREALRDAGRGVRLGQALSPPRGGSAAPRAERSARARESLAAARRDALRSQAPRAARAPRRPRGARRSRRRRHLRRSGRGRRDVRVERVEEGALLLRSVRPADSGRRLRDRSRRARRRAGRSNAALRRRARHRRGEQRQAARRRCPACRPSGAAPDTAARWRWRCRRSGAREAGCRSGSPAARCEGRIAAAPKGDGGFGYDPIFEPAAEPPGGRTLGEWSAEAKNAISHRGKAARRMRKTLLALGF